MAARCCSTKSARWTSGCRPSCCAPCRSAKSTASAARAPVRVNVRILATTNRDLPAEVRARHVPRGSVFPPERRHRCASRRCASGPATSPRWPIISPRRYADVNGLPLPPAVAAPPRSAGRASLARQRARAGEHASIARCCWPTGPDDRRRGDRDSRGPTAAGERSGHASGGIASLVGRRMEEVERDLIIETLGHTLGNRTHAATILGISIRALRNKLRDYAAQGVAVPPPAVGVAA